MEIAGRYRAKFGNRPIWHETLGLIWLDSADKKIIIYNPVRDEEVVYDAQGAISAIIPTKNGQLIGVYQDGLYFVNFKQQTKKPFVVKKMLTEMQYFNDAKCGPDGKIWIGTADTFFQKFRQSKQLAHTTYPFQCSKLYTVDIYGELAIQLENTSNLGGLEWDRKTNKFYLIDTSKYEIYQYEMNEKGHLQLVQVVYTFAQSEGYPNGMAIDEEGFLYVALYKGDVAKGDGASQIARIDPQQQRIDVQWDIPVSCVTSCTIGGEKMDTLFITTAYGPLPEYKVREEGLAGYVVQIPIAFNGVLPFQFNTAIIEGVT